MDAGEVAAGEVAVMLGENATGKTTFLKMLLGILEPDDVAVDLHEVNVSMKPQSLSPRVTGTVRDLLYKRVRDACTQPTFIADVMKPMRVRLRRKLRRARPDCSDAVLRIWKKDAKLRLFAGGVVHEHIKAMFINTLGDS